MHQTVNDMLVGNAVCLETESPCVYKRGNGYIERTISYRGYLHCSFEHSRKHGVGNNALVIVDA